MAGGKPLAFSDAHAAGLCSLAYLPAEAGSSGSVALVTAGPDGKLCFRSADAPSEVQKEMLVANGGAPTPLHCLAVAAGKPVVTGDDANFVKCYTHPDGEMDGVATRFTLPVRALAYSPSGASLAAGGDDEGIKLVDMASARVFRQLKSQAYTRSIAYDPEGAYIASVNGDGTLNVWEIEGGKQQLCRRKACPKVDLDSTARCQPAWHPDGGSLLAAPGTEKGDIVLYERMSWEAAFSLAGQHSDDVSLLAFSPNGLYLASAGMDQALCLWDVNERTCLEKRLLPGSATGLAWHPSKNELAVITEDGQLAVWQEPVPAKLPGPTADVDALAGIKQKGAAAAGAGDGVSVLEGGADAPTGMAATEDEYDQEDSFLADSAPKAYRGTKGRRGGYGAFSSFDLPQPQDAIQPGATEMGDNGRRYLAYNSLGAITLRQEEDYNVVEVTFHDTARMRKRVPLLSDFFGFTCGALGEKGALYASRSNADSASTVVYRPYESWAPNSDWSLALPKGEEAECAAAGSSFCAVATSWRHLRLFSQAGTQTHLLTLPGAPVALAARRHQLAAVWHGGPPTASGDQCLHYALYDVAERKATEQYWIVGLSARELQAIVCANSPEPAVPSGNQRPVVTAVPLRPPVVAQDAALAPFEADLIRHGALLSHVTAAAADAKDGDDASELEGAVHQAQLEADRITLRLIQKLLAADRQARALEAVGTLHNMPALEGALKLANHHRATALAERISAFIEQRLAMEAAAAELEQEDGYGDGEAAGRQHGAVTPVPGPAFDDEHAASPAGGAATAGNMSRAPSPAPRAVVGGGGGGTNPFARKPAAEAPENSPGNASTVAAAAAAKRKAPSSNPFARKSKAAKA
ncbi:hypothetical protein COHA_007091 [Chlorella ohadii]|uniref:Minichromosome loss protein Mcl1 middle region domain-containing protein n=1 Tax=Chlorella ohadii TaxID=2649997 RepID=A0AAD5DKA2_9CHLO|nr:hypothetical protein COHA_007091 [Chlorella ohadii]